MRESKTSVNSESNQYLDILVSNSEKRVKKEPDIFSFIEFSPIKPDLSMSNNPHGEDEAFTLSWGGSGQPPCHVVILTIYYKKNDREIFEKLLGLVSPAPLPTFQDRRATVLQLGLAVPPPLPLVG